MNIEDPKIVDEKFLSKKCAWLYYVAKLNQNQIANSNLTWLVLGFIFLDP